jgi:hypothetical protein
MAVVNPYVAPPLPPGEWVDDEKCICGASYHAHKVRTFKRRRVYSRRRGVRYSSPFFASASDRLRRIAKAQGDKGGGFRSRGPVLWMMRVIKLADWYDQHHGCEGLL